MKILIVDDSTTSLALIEKALRELNFSDYAKCTSAKAALQILKVQKIDCMLLDWHMPEMDGLELLKLLKSDEETKHIPVMMLTVEGNAKNVGLAIENGAEGYFIKPVNKELLQIRLKDIESNQTLGLKK
jgi:two-component system chemotaxis response regulator CheY